MKKERKHCMIIIIISSNNIVHINNINSKKKRIQEYINTTNRYRNIKDNNFLGKLKQVMLKIYYMSFNLKKFQNLMQILK